MEDVDFIQPRSRREHCAKLDMLLLCILMRIGCVGHALSCVAVWPAMDLRARIPAPRSRVSA